jgi:hypothetical protein
VFPLSGKEVGVRYVWHALAGPAIFFELVFIPVDRGEAEIIYRWRGPDGFLYFSNVSPPGGVVDFSTLTGISFKPEVPASTASPGDIAVVKDGTPVEDGSDPDSRRMAAFLEDRVQCTERSIEQLEVLLGDRSNDESLRTYLSRRKQQLHEDRIRLDLLTD